MCLEPQVVESIHRLCDLTWDGLVRPKWRTVDSSEARAGRWKVWLERCLAAKLQWLSLPGWVFRFQSVDSGE